MGDREKKDKKKKDKQEDRTDEPKKPSEKKVLDAKLAELQTELAAVDKVLDDHKKQLESLKTLHGEEKKKKDKQEDRTDEPKKPLEKKVFEAKVAELQTELEAVDQVLDNHKKQLESLKTLHGEENNKKKKDKQEDRTDEPKKPSEKKVLDAKVAELQTQLEAVEQVLDDHKKQLESLRTLHGEENKKKKKKKDKQEDRTDEPKKPSEKKVFEAKVAELQTELEAVDQVLNDHKKQLESLKILHGEELASKEACIAHLQRMLKTRTEEGSEEQQQLKLLQDMTDLTEKRASDLFRNINRSREMNRNTYQQHMTELEDKLSHLEEPRLKRNNQMDHLKRVMDDLEQQISTRRQKNRDDSISHIGLLLTKRERFKDLVDDYSKNCREVFDLSLPVYAQNQFSENLRLRTACSEASEQLLGAQDRSRHLKQLQKTLGVELETQNSADAGMRSLESRLRDRLNTLHKKGASLASKQWVGRGDIEGMKQEIRRIGLHIAQVEDNLRVVKDILDDQDQYSQSLEIQIQGKIDKNGTLASTILRALNIIKGRLGEQTVEEDSMDYDLLQQIRMILDDPNGRVQWQFNTQS